MESEDEEAQGLTGGLTGDSSTDAGIQPSEEAVKKSKESDERTVKRMLDPRRPTKAEVEDTSCSLALPQLVPCLC